MEIKLDRVKRSEKNVLYRLLQYSLFEESLTDGNEMNEEAVFEYRWFDDYFVEEVREAYLIREEETDKLLGFVMINPYLQKINCGHSIAEFMVLPKYRRNRWARKQQLNVLISMMETGRYTRQMAVRRHIYSGRM